jgi:hypothetical protein
MLTTPFISHPKPESLDPKPQGREVAILLLATTLASIILHPTLNTLPIQTQLLSYLLRTSSDRFFELLRSWLFWASESAYLLRV